MQVRKARKPPPIPRTWSTDGRLIVLWLGRRDTNSRHLRIQALRWMRAGTYQLVLTSNFVYILQYTKLRLTHKRRPSAATSTTTTTCYGLSRPKQHCHHGVRSRGGRHGLDGSACEVMTAPQQHAVQQAYGACGGWGAVHHCS
jgi:hypothetical protein